jgi:uncharacterized protein YllA (UPF0747 family)
MNPRVITQSIAGNPLAVRAIAGEAPNGWYEEAPRSADAWRQRVDQIRSQFDADWLSRLSPAIAATGEAAARLSRAADGKGVVVTTGQQAGLFGGPIYTLSKALTAVAFADALEAATGIPVAPVFWAATDDTDFREASSTIVAQPGGAQLLRMDHLAPLGRPMSEMPLGDLGAELEALAAATGATIDLAPIEALRRTYTSGETVGSAYVKLLRELFEPLGLSVIDASHPATRSEALPVLRSALAHASEISDAIANRNAEIEREGFAPQVQDMPGLSLVFSTSSGSRKRIPIKAARKHAVSEDMGPNVLLRPIVERAILPTAAYLGGPAEIAYFAQLHPVAAVLGSSQPLILPRWSCTIIEPHVDKTLRELNLRPEDFRDPHEVEGRVARNHLPPRVLAELSTTREVVDARLEQLGSAVSEEGAPIAQAVVGGLRANLTRRLDRFERRLIAAAKKEQATLMKDLATARGSLYPMGKPQERALNFIPFLARYGPALRDEMLSEARKHSVAFTGTANPTVQTASASQSR